MTTRPLSRYPSEARIHSELGLLTWHPRGMLDASLAREILDFVEAEEATDPQPFHRFADLTALNGIHLDSLDLTELTSRRAFTYHGPEVKTAILAFNPLDFGIAQMYARLMRKSPIEVRVFCRITSAAVWLNMPIEVLAAA